MTAVLVGILVLLAALMWTAAASVAGPTVPRAALDRGVGRDAAPGGSAGDSAGVAPTPRWSGCFATRRGRRRADRAEAEALELLDGLAPALRAGLPPVTALRLVTSTRTVRIAARSPSWAARRFGHRPETTGDRAWSGSDTAVVPGGPHASAWAGLDAAASQGDPLAPTWAAYAAAVDSDDLRLVAAAWSLCETLGSPLAPTVTTVADVVRRRRAVRHRIAAALAGPQATMRILTALPLSGPLVAVVVGVAPAELYAGAAGVSSLVVGLLLLLLGRAWASRMVRAVTIEQRGPATPRRELSDVGR